MSARDIIEAIEHETRLVVSVLFATLVLALPVSAQSPLSLSEAIARAKARNPDAGSAAAAEREAAARVTQVRGGYLPTVDVAESWQRGNHPVFVFTAVDPQWVRGVRGRRLATQLQGGREFKKSVTNQDDKNRMAPYGSRSTGKRPEADVNATPVRPDRDNDWKRSPSVTSISWKNRPGSSGPSGHWSEVVNSTLCVLSC